MTVFIQILFPDERLKPNAWVPWLNSTPDDETVAMSAHKWLRDRGGLTEDESQVIHVCWYTDKMPLHPNGSPQVCRVSIIRITPTPPG